MYLPPGFTTVTPYFFVAEADRFVAFLVAGLGGTETCRTLRPDGCPANAQMRLGTATVMVSEASAAHPPYASWRRAGDAEWTGWTWAPVIGVHAVHSGHQPMTCSITFSSCSRAATLAKTAILDSIAAHIARAPTAALSAPIQPPLTPATRCQPPAAKPPARPRPPPRPRRRQRP